MDGPKPMSLAFKRIEDIAEFVPSMALHQSQQVSQTDEEPVNNTNTASRWNVDSSVFVPGGVGPYIVPTTEIGQPTLSPEEFPPIRPLGNQSTRGMTYQKVEKPPIAPPSQHMIDVQPQYYIGPPSPQKVYSTSAGYVTLKPTQSSHLRMGAGGYYSSGTTTTSVGPDNTASDYSMYYGHPRAQSPGLAATSAQYHTALHHAQPVTQPGRRHLNSFFVSESLRADLQKKTMLLLRGTNPDDVLTQGLPKLVHKYHSLYPLEDGKERLSKVYNLPTFCYKAISIQDGKSYVLRKVDNFRIMNEYAASQAIEIWKSISHPGIVSLKDVFICPAFNSIPSLFFVYDYYPGAETLEQKFPADKAKSGGFVSEETLWSIIIQVVSALKVIHSRGLYGRIVPSKILWTGKNRIRLNCIGMDDVLNIDHRRSITNKQMEDIINLGTLIVRLACASVDPTNVNSLPHALESVAGTYSAELHNFLLRLLGLNPGRNRSTGSPPTLDEIQQMLAPRLLGHIDRLYTHSDFLEGEIAKEVENGRLFRLMVKLGFINERPEFDMSGNWSETGDRYLLKLFRDYIFHQVDEDGNPVIDLTHVVECLNKLDIGVDEKVLLMSRDEKSMMIVSYKDLHRCLAEAFNELVTRQQMAQQNQIQASATAPPNYYIPTTTR